MAENGATETLRHGLASARSLVKWAEERAREYAARLQQEIRRRQDLMRQSEHLTEELIRVRERLERIRAEVSGLEVRLTTLRKGKEFYEGKITEMRRMCDQAEGCLRSGRPVPSHIHSWLTSLHHRGKGPGGWPP